MTAAKVSPEDGHQERGSFEQPPSGMEGAPAAILVRSLSGLPEVEALADIDMGRGVSTMPSPRRLVIDAVDEIPTRFKPTRRTGYRHKRTLTNRIRQLRADEHELKVYEALVSRSLNNLGLDQNAFDAKVQVHSESEIKVIHDQIGSEWSIDERFTLASSFVKLAMWRIDPGSVEWSLKRSRHFFVLAHSPHWFRLVKVCLILYVVVLCFEAERTWVAPLSGLPGSRPWPWWVQLLETVAALGILADLLVALGFQRFEAIVESRQNYVRAFIAVGCFVDLLVALFVYHLGGGHLAYLRWSRPMRLLYLPFANRATYNSVLSIIDTLPSLGDLLLLALVFTFIWAVIGVSAFATADLRSYGGSDANSFESFDLAFTSLATLLTGENFPNIMWPALNYDTATFLFFIGFVLVGTVMVMPATIAIVFEYYKRFHSLKVLEEKMVERRCLLMSFALVDEDNSGLITFDEFAKLLVAVHPEASATERSLLFKLLDSDNSATITAVEFVRLSDVLLLAVRGEQHTFTRRWPFFKWKLARVRPLIESKWFERSVMALILVYVVLLGVQAHPSLSEVVPARLDDVIDGLFIGIFALELVLKMSGLSIAGYFADTWNRVDFGVILVSAAMLVIRATISKIFGQSSVFAPARVLRVLRVLRTIRTVSIFSHSRKLRNLTKLFVLMRPVMLTILGTIVMVLYLYLVVGLEALSGKASYSAAEIQACGNYCPSFDSVLLGTITMLQLVLASNWSSLIANIHGDGGTFVTWLFTISFVLVANAVMLPLLSALILEVYSMETDKLVSSSSHNQLATLFPQEALGRSTGGVGADNYVVVLSNGVRKMFEHYDKDSSNSISALELSQLLADLGEPLEMDELKKVLASLAVDQEGQISFGEFLVWWQRYGLEKVFRRFDQDESGTIDAKELGSLMAEVGSPMSHEELESALRELDSDNSGAIGFDEYASWFGDYDVRRVFASFDKDASNTISTSELEALMAHMGFELSKDELKLGLARLDANRDGGISFVEFLPWWKELQRSKEEKSFVVQENRGKRWEENLFLRKRASDGLSMMLRDASCSNGGHASSSTESFAHGGSHAVGGSSGAQQAADRFVQTALLRRIASDFSMGKVLSEDFLLSHYAHFDANSAQQHDRPRPTVGGELSQPQPAETGVGPSSTPGLRRERSSSSRTASSSAPETTGAHATEPSEHDKFRSLNFPNVLQLTALSPRRRSANQERRSSEPAPQPPRDASSSLGLLSVSRPLGRDWRGQPQAGSGQSRHARSSDARGASSEAEAPIARRRSDESALSSTHRPSFRELSPSPREEPWPPPSPVVPLSAVGGSEAALLGGQHSAADGSTERRGSKGERAPRPSCAAAAAAGGAGNFQRALMMGAGEHTVRRAGSGDSDPS